MRRILKAALFLFLSGLITAAAYAEVVREAGKPSIRIEGRKNIVVSQHLVRLSDIAEVSSPLIEDDEAVIALQKINIDPAPPAGQTATISASRILQRLKEEGVKLSDVIYVLPRITAVARAGRMLSETEIESALKENLKGTGREAGIKQIILPKDILVPPDVSEIKASPAQSIRPGLMKFYMVAATPAGEEVRFEVSARIDEWVNVPTAKRYLPRGEMVGADDIVMARMNIATLANDAAHIPDEIIGKEVVADIQYGESFRKAKLDMPVLIESGAKVTLSYVSGVLEATATGFAMEPGVLGQQIKVRNESSKKIITGKVLEAGRVGVNQ